MSDRYDGKPFLWLLERYVLWSVQKLPQGQVGALDGMTPRLAATYNTDGSWQEIVADQMEFPPDLPEALRDMWQRTLIKAGVTQDAIDPELWAQQVVDSNFV